MCEGKVSEKLTETMLDQKDEQTANQFDIQFGLATELADSYLGDYWGLGFANRRPH